MLFCFRKQNFAEIRQSVNELWPKKWFLRWRLLPSWIPKISIFGHVTVTGFNIWCSAPNFIKIGRFFTEIWRFNDFWNGGRLPCWILKICSFCHLALVDMPFCFLIPPPSWISKISIFGHVTVIGFNICCRVPNFIKIGWFFTEIWRFSDLQDGGRQPSWICYDATVLHRRTHFRCANIVLKFLVDRCCKNPKNGKKTSRVNTFGAHCHACAETKPLHVSV